MNIGSATIITGIDITTYMVKDADRAKAFYRDVLGLAVTKDYGPYGAEFELGDGGTFGIWKDPDGPADAFKPCGHVMFAVGDINAAVVTYKARGVHFEDDGRVEETPVCFMAFAKDTEGNSFLLHQRK